MNRRLELAMVRRQQRNEVAHRVATACEKMGVKVLATDGNGGGVLVVENAEGTQFTLTVARRQRQDNG